jgi:multisubunit Na+/H+ antiporter MnhB subunit
MTIDSNAVGLLLIALVLIAYGVRIAARGRPDRRRWSQGATFVIVAVLVGLVLLFASYWIIPDPEKL